MIMLEPNQVCPYGSFCGYSDDYMCKCRGLDPNRATIFICELWAENYDEKGLEDARNY